MSDPTSPTPTPEPVTRMRPWGAPPAAPATPATPAAAAPAPAPAVTVSPLGFIQPVEQPQPQPPSSPFSTATIQLNTTTSPAQEPKAMSSGFSSSDLAPKTPSSSSSSSSSNGGRSRPGGAPAKPEWLTRLFGWKRRRTTAGMFVAGITFGIIAMKMFGPKSADPQSAAAVSPSNPSAAPQNAETVIETDDGSVQI